MHSLYICRHRSRSSAVWRINAFTFLSFATQRSLRVAGGGGATLAEGEEPGPCDDEKYFLGVANPKCLASNIFPALSLCLLIIFLAMGLNWGIARIRLLVKQRPQLKKIVERLFEEIMTLGFISMLFVVMNSFGLTEKLADLSGTLTGTQVFHFKEFFHYVVFVTMMYYIGLVLSLVLMATVVPQYLWYEQDGLSRLKRSKLGEFEEVDSVTLNVIYNKLREKYKAMGWRFTISVAKRFEWWKITEVIGYELCKSRSRPIYRNPDEMRRIFELSPAQAQDVQYRDYNKYMMRNLLVHILEIHWSIFLMLFLLITLNSLRVYATDKSQASDMVSVAGILVVGGLLLLFSIIIMVKTFDILRGIVKDRLKLIDIQRVERFRLSYYSRGDQDDVAERLEKLRKQKLRTLATAVRFIVRMKLSSSCHRALHSHDNRFWFGRPAVLLRLFQGVTFSQAFFLMWITLIEWRAILQVNNGWIYLLILCIMSSSVIFIVTPLTLPSLVLVMSLTEFFFAQNLVQEQSSRTLDRAVAVRIHSRRVRETFRQRTRIEEMEANESDEEPDDDNASIQSQASSMRIFTSPVRHLFSMTPSRLLNLSDLTREEINSGTLIAGTLARVRGMDRFHRLQEMADINTAVDNNAEFTTAEESANAFDAEVDDFKYGPERESSSTTWEYHKTSTPHSHGQKPHELPKNNNLSNIGRSGLVLTAHGSASVLSVSALRRHNSNHSAGTRSRNNSLLNDPAATTRASPRQRRGHPLTDIELEEGPAQSPAQSQ